MGADIFRLPWKCKTPYPGTRGFLDAKADASPWDDGAAHNIGFVPASLGLLAIDLDRPQHFEEARSWGLFSEPTFEVETADGVHLYFKGIAPTHGCPVGSLIVRAAHGFTLLPPSTHPKGPKYRARTKFVDAKPLPERFAAALCAAETREGSRERVQQAFKAASVTPGDRHSTLLTIAGHLAARHVAQEHALELIHAFNLVRCHPPKPDFEVTRAVAFAYEREASKPSKDDATGNDEESPPRLLRAIRGDVRVRLGWGRR